VLSVRKSFILLMFVVYKVTCAIMQKNGAGVHTSLACHWDTVTDGVVTVKWPGDKQKDQNKSMYCIVTVFGLGM